MPGGGDAFGCGVYDKDYGRGTFGLGEAEGLDLVQGVRGGDGAWVAGGTHGDTAWEGSRVETALGIHGLQQGTTDVQDGLPDRGGVAELLS